MALVSKEDLAKSLKLEKYGPLGIHIANSLLKALKIKDINELYDRYNHLSSLDFVNAILDDLGITLEISSTDMKRLPKSGPFVIVANHPLGAIDGLIMLKILLTHNPESKILANFILKKIEPIAHCVCAVNPFETRKDVFSSSAGIRQALTQISEGKPLGIFPAGEVSMRNFGFYGEVTDKVWEVSALKLIKKAHVPVVPIYFHAKNSNFFYWLSALNGHLRTATLPSEVVNAKNKKVIVRIGQPISIIEQEEIKDITIYGEYLRQKTYLLKEPFKNKKRIGVKKLFPIIEKAISTQTLVSANDVFQKLKQEGTLLFCKGDYEIFFTKLDKYPELINELGRLRELTFRDVGEGTLKSLDIDVFDLHYHHLILWDTKNNEIVGAYRMALGSDVYKVYGKKGFYMTKLFKMKGEMKGILSQSIEMGRAFIQKSYQNKPFPLFILWQGIAAVAQKHPEHKYLIGAASISSSYSFYSRAMMVEYLKNHQLDKELAKFITPKVPFKYKLKKDDINIKTSDIKKIDKLIEEIEPTGAKLPILIKKYLWHNAKVLGFNVDPAFNDAIDVLIYMKIEDIDRDKFGV